MKKFLTLAAIALMACACSEDRGSVLKVYNWSNYIGENVISDFEKWYEEQTGEKVDVIYQTFDINETMLSKIEKGHEDYDVVCPSDYIIERMLNEGLLLPLDFESLGDTPNYIENNRSPFMKEMFSRISPTADANAYSVPFMWGTTGILYNPKYVTDEEAATWDVIRNPKFADKILMKDAPRDVYGPVLIYLKQKELAEGSVTLDDLMKDSSDESIAAVESFLGEVSQLVAGWEADFGKEQMTQERAWISLNWSGDAVWAIEEGAAVGVELRYAVPAEGSNVWFDGWVIPKYAKNVKAATFFINFMCREDIAIRNMEETGYVSANGARAVIDSQVDEELDPVDVSYFFPGADSVRVDPVLYPDRSIIEHCTMMHDWGADTDKLISMWSRVKGSNANAMTVIVIAAVALAIIAAVLVKKLTSRKSSRRKTSKKR